MTSRLARRLTTAGAIDGWDALAPGLSRGFPIGRPAGVGVLSEHPVEAAFYQGAATQQHMDLALGRAAQGKSRLMQGVDHRRQPRSTANSSVQIVDRRVSRALAMEAGSER